MKKVLLTIAAAALLLTSCVKEQFAGADGDKVKVSFGLAIDNGVQTRADAASATADKLYYAVFDEDGVLLDDFKATAKTVASYPTTVDLTLTKSQTYTVAFWAQNSSCTAYTVSEDMKITMDYAGANNDAARDAFFGTETITVDGNNNHEVKLTRPFAQINAGVTAEDWNAAVKTDFTVSQSMATVSDVPTALDVLTGEVSGSADVEYTLAAIPTASLSVAGTDYHWLSMSYILAGTSSTHDVTFTFNAEGKTPVVLSEGLSNIPVNRNWRTNIIGTLLTGNVQFKIELDENFGGETNIEGEKEPEVYSVTIGDKMYKTINEALKAANDNDVINLGAGEYDLTNNGAFVKSQTSESVLVISNGVTIQGATGLSAKDVILNGSVKMMNGALKNVTLSGKDVADGGNLMTSAFNGDCLVEGVIFNCPATGTVNAFKEYSGVGDGKAYSLTFKNCEFNLNGQRALQFYIMNVTVEGCTFDNPYRYVVQLGDYAKGCNLTFKNNTVKNYGSTNKEFYTYVQVADQGSEADNVVVLEGNTHDGSVAEKWQDYVIENTASNVEVTVNGREALADGVLYDPETKVAEITKGGDIQIAAALEAGAAELRLADGEYTLPGNIKQTDGNVTMVGAGENTVLSGSGNTSGVSVTMKNLTWKSKSTGYDTAFTHAESVVFEDCHIIGQYYAQSLAPHIFKNCTIDPQTGYLYTYGANCTFEGCTFLSSEGKALQVYTDSTTGESTVTINNCTFKAAKVANTWDGKPVTAIDINSFADANGNGHKFTVVVTNSTAIGYGTGIYSGSDFWNIKGGPENVTLTIDGKYPPVKMNGLYFATLKSAIAYAGETEVLDIELAEGTYTIPDTAKKTLNFVGVGDVAGIVVNGHANLSGSKATFENVTLKLGNAGYQGLQHIAGAAYKDCVFEGLHFLYGDSTFDSCTFNNTGDNYNVWTYGTNPTFNECTFNCDGKAVLVYTENNNVDDTVTFNSCVFNDNEGLANETKAAVETGANAATVKHTLIINNCTVNGFAQTGEKSNLGGDSLGDTYWGNKNLMSRDNLNVFIDGTEVY